LKRILFDHNVPARLGHYLKAFDVKLARHMGWAELKNGKLLQAAEDGGFEVLLTADQTIPTENEIAGRRIGLTCMSANNWNIVSDYVPEISEALHKCKPGQVLPVFCGKFVRGKFRAPAV
jgi:hypothetical protein